MHNYARVSRDKIKSRAEMTSRWKHNERVFDVANADPNIQNIELVDAQGKDYNTLFNDVRGKLQAEGFAKHNVRKNAVFAMEFNIGYSRERTDINVQEWAKDTMKWLDNFVNPPDHKISREDENGKMITSHVQNIRHAVLHLDESNPHIHAFVIPIDAKGELNASAYDGPLYLKQMQTSYAKAMKKYGLERGVENSIARREDISRYHTELNRAVNAKLRDPQPGETIEEYKAYAEKTMQNVLIHHRDEIVRMTSERNEAISEKQNVEKKLEQAVKIGHDRNRRLRAAAGEYGEGEMTDREFGEVVQRLADNRKFHQAVQRYPDRSVAENAERMRLSMVLWMEEEERRKAREKEKERQKENAENRG